VPADPDPLDLPGTAQVQVTTHGKNGVDIVSKGV